jgi:hypothetical protein
VARQRQPLRGVAAIGLKVGAVLDWHKMAKYFILDVADNRFGFARKTEEIAAEAALDGIYVVRTSLPATVLDDPTTVRSYKSLSLVGRAFRCLKSVDLQIRPVYHWLADRVRAHAFLCMLAHYLEWHMRQRLALMLDDDTDKDAAEAQRASVVAKAVRSPAAITKQTTGQTEDGLPVHSFRTLLARSCHADPKHPGDRHRARALLHPVGSAHGSPTEGARPPRPRPYPISQSLADYRSVTCTLTKQEVPFKPNASTCAHSRRPRPSSVRPEVGKDRDVVCPSRAHSRLSTALVARNDRRRRRVSASRHCPKPEERYTGDRPLILAGYPS